MTRNPDNLIGTIQAGTEVVYGDAFDLESLGEALKGIHTAYYLVHSMGSDEDFEMADRNAAQFFAAACTEQGVKRIVYLGGLGNPDHKLSKHLHLQELLRE